MRFHNLLKQAVKTGFGFLIILVLSLFEWSLFASAPRFLNPPLTESQSGYFSLQWESDSSKEFQLERSHDQNFLEPQLIYEGRDLAHFVSGLEDGQYFYRIRANDSEWSEPISVIVQHHPLSFALGLATVGLFVFLATTAAIVWGSLFRREELS